MENKMTGNQFFSRQRFLVAVLPAAGLALLSIVSYFFLDERVVAWLVQNHPSDFEKISLIKAIVLLGKVWLPVWLLLCWALLAGRRQEALVALAALFLLIFTVQPLKVITQRPRPRDAIKQHNEVHNKPGIFHNCSFPSGDTASVFAVAVAVSPFVGWFAGCVIFALAVCVGVIRVVSLAHYPSDVFAGAAIGILSGWLAYWLAMTMPFLKNLVKLLTPIVIFLAIIIITAVVGLFGKLEDFMVFLKFYPPAVVILYLLSKIRKSRKPVI